MPIISKLVKGIGSGIGLATEAISDRKDRKLSEQKDSQVAHEFPADVQSQPGQAGQTGSVVDRSHGDEEDSDSSSTDGEDLDGDNAAWALDDAAHDTDSPPTYEEVAEEYALSPDQYAASFLDSHQPSTPAQEYSPLPLPVILPQRRPKDKSRGFVRAYAPMLGEHSGIDQQTFMDFLEDFDKASKSSPIFNVINIACFGVGFIPSPIAMGVSTAVQIGNRAGQEAQTRYRCNTYLDHINDTLFRPRGLYCMIMTIKPDHPHDPVVSMDINPHQRALAKVLDTPDTEMGRKLQNLRLSSGIVDGEISIPESAPLIYPGLEAAVAAKSKAKARSKTNTLDLPSSSPAPPASTSDTMSTTTTTTATSAIPHSSAFIASYLDRRAQALYKASNPTSNLSALQPANSTEFASRYSDPNHPTNSGSLLALLSGGNIDPRAQRRVRRAERHNQRRGLPPITDQERVEIAMGRLSVREKRRKEKKGGKSPRRKKEGKGLVGRVLQKNVLYLAIVNLPSESELREIREEVRRMVRQAR